MTLTCRAHQGFEHLETATKNVNSWPTWKKELAGIDHTENKLTERQNTCTSTQTGIICACNLEETKALS